MNSDIQQHLDHYFLWMKEETQIKLLDNGWASIVLPYLDQHRDYIQIYLKFENGEIVLSDGGDLYSDLLSSGYFNNTPEERARLKRILAHFNVNLEEDHQIMVFSSKENIPSRLSDFVQALQVVGLMFSRFAE